MTWYERIEELLNKNMTEKGFKLWKGIDNMLPTIWDKPTSSTGKYHQKAEGYVPDCAEHTYEMLHAAVPLLGAFNVTPTTTDADMILLAIVLHDSMKYGKEGELKHTTGKHDQLVGNMVEANKKTIQKLLTESQTDILIDSVRYHSGRWSTDATKAFDFSQFNSIVMFIHMLDMLSTKDLIKIPHD